MSQALTLINKLLEYLEKSEEKKPVFYKPCEDAGVPIASKYDCKGKTIEIDDLSIYVAVNENNIKSENAIVFIYDIFGWGTANKNIFNNCDILANNGYFTICPNFFRNRPWSVDKYPPIDHHAEEFGKWFSSVASFDVVYKDFENIILPYLKKEGIKRIFVVGLCWGGLMIGQLFGNEKATQKYVAGVIVHGSRITKELIEQVHLPIALMPASNDGDYAPFKEILDKKPFGKECFYKFYKDQVHGFMGTRSNWTDPKVKVDVDDVLHNTVNFFNKFTK